MDVIDYDDDLRVKIDSLDDTQFYGKIEDKPEIEQDLFRYQKEYYDAQTESERLDVWKKMFATVQVYARSMVLQKLKNKTFLPPDEVQEKAATAALSFMSQYLNRLNFHVGASFGSMINFKVLEAVYSDAKDDSLVSLNIEEDDKDVSLLSMSKKLGINFLWGESYNDVEDTVVESVYEFINEFENEIDSELTSDEMKLKYRMYLLLLIKKPKNYHIKDAFIKFVCTSKKDIDLMNLIEMELYKRYTNVSKEVD